MKKVFLLAALIILFAALVGGLASFAYAAPTDQSGQTTTRTSTGAQSK